jgi:large subunit ribosomal protein L20
LYNTKIGLASKEQGISYSKFIHALNKANVKLDRKILADLAEHQPQIFNQIIAKVK